MFRASYHPSSGVTELYTFRYGNGSQRSPKRCRRGNKMEASDCVTRSSRYAVTLDFSQRALHLRGARNIDAPASISFPRRHLFGLLWEPLPYLNVYSSVTPDDG